MTRFSSIVVASQFMAKEIAGNAPGLDRSQIRVIPLPVVGWTAQPTTPAPKQRTGRVAFVGRVTRYKGCDVLVEALAEVQQRLGIELTLVVAGTGPWLTRIERLAQARRVALETAGWLTTEQIRSLLEGVDVLALPSLWPEPFGLVGLEAGALGVPAIGFGVGGIPDWLEAGVNGECVSPRSGLMGLTEALARLLIDDAYRHRLAIGAWERSRLATMQRHWSEIRSELVSAVEARKE